MNGKVELEGELFTLVEDATDEDGDISICAEIAGIDIWSWLSGNNGSHVKITLEKLDG